MNRSSCIRRPHAEFLNTSNSSHTLYVYNIPETSLTKHFPFFEIHRARLAWKKTNNRNHRDVYLPYIHIITTKKKKKNRTDARA